MIIDERVMQQRLDGIVKEISQVNADVMVIFSQGSTLGYCTKSHAYMRYFCDWDSHNTSSILMFCPEKSPTLIVSNVFLESLAHQRMCFNDIVSCTPPTMAKALIRRLSDMSNLKKIAFIGYEETPAPFWKEIESYFSEHRIEWINFEAAVDEKRKVKDPLQLANHQKAADICDSMFRHLKNCASSGKNSHEIKIEVENVARVAGCEYSLTWLTIAKAADYSRFYREECLRVPQRGDQVLCGIMILYRGHWGHAIRMGSIEESSTEQIRAFDIVYEMQEAALECLVPGGDLSEVNRAFLKTFGKYYPDEKNRDIFRFRDAHGIGHAYEEPITSDPFPQPYLDKPLDENLEILPGMLFEFHPNFFVSNKVGAALGDMIFVTERGPIILTQFPREYIYF